MSVDVLPDVVAPDAVVTVPSETAEDERLGKTRAKAAKADATIAAAIDQARAAAEETASDFGVGEHLGCVSEGSYLATHYFACTHPAYPGWRWAVIMTRVPRARSATIDEVVLVPAEAALLAPGWVPWSQRLQAGDVQPGMLLPTPENDPRLEPGFVQADMVAEDDAAEWSQTRAVVNELGLGRERVLSAYGRDEAAQRWLSGSAGPDNQMSRLAPAACLTCGYMIRLAGSLGGVFGVCANEFSPSDGRVVSIEHGCGGHSDVVADDRGVQLPQAVFDTISTDPSLFD